MSYKNLFFILSLLLILSTSYSLESRSCDNPLFCNGAFLRTIQMARAFNDSKTFVDRPSKAPPEVVLEAFRKLPPHPSKELVKSFVDTWFFDSGVEVRHAAPVDWSPMPQFVEDLPPHLKEFGLSIHSKWKDLVRVFAYQGICDRCHSSLAVPHPFVVAGGRFTEYYYWDSLWILEGLLVSGMVETALGYVNNMLYLVEKYGMMPNGGRIYYLNRSQPPVLSLMVRMIYETTYDMTWLQKALPILEMELKFWNEERSVEFTIGDKNYTMARFRADTDEPRPESLYEDVHLSNTIKDDHGKKDLFRSIASGAESGWDFSSRWFKNKVSMNSINVENVIPVDLNNILYSCDKALSFLYMQIGNTEKAIKFEMEAFLRRTAIHEVFWNEVTQSWTDYHLDSQSRQNDFYSVNFIPLWSGAFHQGNIEIWEKSIKPIWEHMLLPGGIPTSFIVSGQQWDYPSAWAPLQAFLIDGLDGLNLQEARDHADQLASVWVTSNYCAWNATKSSGGLFYEKYDARSVGKPGGGGEYKVQTGFGWTNGVLLKILKSRGHRLVLGSCH